MAMPATLSRYPKKKPTSFIPQFPGPASSGTKKSTASIMAASASTPLAIGPGGTGPPAAITLAAMPLLQMVTLSTGNGEDHGFSNSQATARQPLHKTTTWRECKRPSVANRTAANPIFEDRGALFGNPETSLSPGSLV